MAKKRAFIDTNVLVDVLSGSHTGKELVDLLAKEDIEMVIFKKSLYEVSLALHKTKHAIYHAQTVNI